MSWQDNLMNNLLVVAILLALAIIVYCGIKKVTLTEVLRQIKEGLKNE